MRGMWDSLLQDKHVRENISNGKKKEHHLLSAGTGGSTKEKRGEGGFHAGKKCRKVSATKW